MRHAEECGNLCLHGGNKRAIAVGDFHMASSASTSNKTWQTLSGELAKTIEQIGASVVAVHARHRHASSGLLWRDGVIVTANHAVRLEEEISITASGGKTVTATLAGRDPSTDIAALKIQKDADAGLQTATQGGASDLKIGHFVLALGRSARGNVVASSGIISGLMGEWRTWRGGVIDKFIRPDLAMYSGFSGGPLVNDQGQVIGINTSGLRRGTGLTIPHTTVDRVVDELIKKGHIARPYLGLAMQPVRLPDALQKNLNLSASAGLLVIHAEPGGPAEKAGVSIGDIIFEMHGTALSDTDRVQDVLAKKRAGDEVEVGLVRGGARVSVRVTLAERPSR
jgi:serine protease DegQ